MNVIDKQNANSRIPIEKILLVSDLDGTLMDYSGIQERNLEALERFMNRGGHFALATGRAAPSLMHIKGIKTNAPSILMNGGMIYDLNAKKMLWHAILPKQAYETVRLIHKIFPDIGMGLWTEDCMQIITDDSGLVNNNELTLDHHRLVKIDEISYNAIKVVFNDKAEKLAKLEEWVTSQGYDEIDFTHSGPEYFEMLPKDVIKGTTLPILADLCGLKIENTCSIGDYYNDLRMLEIAGFSASTAEAPDEVKAAANIVVGTCKNGAVADFIEYIEQHICAQ